MLNDLTEIQGYNQSRKRISTHCKEIYHDLDTRPLDVRKLELKELVSTFAV